MKINNLTNSVMAVLLLASPFVGAETQYPAADFQPKVLYKDSEYKPAATKDTGSSKSSSNSSAEDAQYPATNFQPKVLYKDEGYKPSPAEPVNRAQTAVKSAPVTGNQTVSEGSVSETSPVNQSESGAMPVYPIILVILGIIGFVFLKNRSKCEGKNIPQTTDKAYKKSGGLTGVAKYVNRVSGTGVARYLEKQVKSAPVTGVAKYVAKQVITAKNTTQDAAASTGVEKYMRNRR